MDAIIRIIIKIFQEIFEKDSNRRQQEAARRAEVLRQWQLKKQGLQPPAQRQNPAARPQRASPAQSKQQTLLERMDSIISEMTNPRPVPPPPPPKMRVQPTRSQTKPNLKASAAARKRPFSQAPAAKVKRQGGKWVLPGSTPLQQMMYAKVILDPCLAIEEERRGF